MNKSIVKKIALGILSVVLAAAFTVFVVAPIFDSYIYLDDPFMLGLGATYLPLILLLMIFILGIIVFYKITTKYTRASLIFVVLLLLGLTYVFKPYEIAAGDAGPYKEGQIVLTVSKSLLFNRPVQLDDVVIYKRSDLGGIDGIAHVVGVPGDKAEEAYYMSNEKLQDDVVPAGFYLVKYGTSLTLRLAPEDQITQIVWFPFK